MGGGGWLEGIIAVRGRSLLSATLFIPGGG